MKQQFQLCLPITLGTSSSKQITINLDSSADEVFNMNPNTRYPDRTSSTSTSVLAYMVDEINTGSALTWAGSYQTGLKGRVRLSAVGGEGVTSITLPQTIADALGFASTTISRTSLNEAVGVYTSIFDAPYRMKGLYIPDPAEEVFYNPYDFSTVRNILSTQSPSGQFVYSDYGSIRKRTIDVLFIRGFSGRECYVDAGFGTDYGVNSNDPNISFEEFMELWRNTGGAARLYLNADSLGDGYKTVYPDVRADYFADINAALEQVSEAPLRYRLTFTVLESN
jgi:hypothetical protein